jgi:hypothetical protein
MRLGDRERMRATKQHEDSRYGIEKGKDFIPSIGVRRVVALEDVAAEALHRKLTNGLKAEFGKQKAKQYEVFSPGSWCMTLLEQAKMIEYLRRKEYRTPPQNVMLLAGSLQSRFEEHKAERGEHAVLYLPLGNAQPFSRNEVKSTVGMPPDGWRGHKAGYAPRGVGEQQLLVPQDIVDERELCVHALRNHTGLGDYEAYDTLSAAPRINVLRHKRGRPFADDEYRRIEAVLNAVMPPELPLSDPIITLQYDRRSKPLVATVPTPERDLTKLAS